MTEDDLEVEVEGVPMPAWLMSRPSNVVTVTFSESPVVVTYEQLFGSHGYTCTWPRYANLINPPDPSHECGFRLDAYDEAAFTEHARTHVEDRS